MIGEGWLVQFLRTDRGAGLEAPPGRLNSCGAVVGRPEGLGAADGDTVGEAVGVGDGDARVLLGVEDLVNQVAILEEVPGERTGVGWLLGRLSGRRPRCEDLGRPPLRRQGLRLRHLLIKEAIPLVRCHGACAVSNADVTELAQEEFRIILVTVEESAELVGGLEDGAHARRHASTAEGDQESVEIVTGEIDAWRVLLLLLLVVVLVLLILVLNGHACQVVLLAHLLAAQRAGALVLLGEPRGCAEDVEDVLAGERNEPVARLKGVVADGAVGAGHLVCLLLCIVGGRIKCEGTDLNFYGDG